MSFRKVFPYMATLVVVLGLFGVFAFRPTPFIGLNPEAMADSLDRQLGLGTSECEKVADGEWSCTVTKPASYGAGPTRDLDIEINAFGCWSAEPVDGKPVLGTPSGLTGCVTLQDH